MKNYFIYLCLLMTAGVAHAEVLTEITGNIGDPISNKAINVFNLHANVTDDATLITASGTLTTRLGDTETFPVTLSGLSDWEPCTRARFRRYQCLSGQPNGS